MLREIHRRVSRSITQFPHPHQHFLSTTGATADGEAIFLKVCTAFNLTYCTSSLPKEVPWAA